MMNQPRGLAMQKSVAELDAKNQRHLVCMPIVWHWIMPGAVGVGWPACCI